MTAPAIPGGMPAGGAGGTSLPRRVEDERRRFVQASDRIVFATAIAVGLAALALFAIVHGDGRWIRLPRPLPLLAWLVAIGTAVGAARWLRRRLSTPQDTAAVARAIEREGALRDGALRGALEVATLGPLGARALADVERRLAADGPLAPAHRAQVERAWRTALLLLVVAIATVAGSAITARDGFTAVAHPIRAWRGLLLPVMRFDALPADIPRGMPVVLQVVAAGRSSVTLGVREGDGVWRDTTLALDADGRARVPLGPMRAALALRLDDGRAPTVETLVGVGDRGWVGDVIATAEYPAYLARPSAELDLLAPVRVPRGTRLALTARAFAGARDVQLIAGTDTTRFGTAPDGALTATLIIDAPTTFVWRAEGTPRGATAALPVEVPEPLRVDVVADGSPEIAFTSPTTDVEIGTAGAATLWMEAADDHGLREIALRIVRERPGDAGAPPRRVTIAAPGAPVWADAARLSLDDYELAPGDRLVVTAVATDDSPWRQTGASRALVLRVPSLSEQRDRARELGDSLAARAAALARAERQLARTTENSARSREMQGDRRSESNGQNNAGSRGDLSYKAAEQAREMAQQQRDLGARVDSLRSGAEELEERLREAGAMDSSLANRFAELQKMLREAMTPEMMAELQKLEQAGERLSGSEARQSLEQLAEQQRRLREQLEQSAEMLKRAALEGAMETMRDEASELAEAQRQLANDAKAGERGTSASEARSLADRSQRLERDLSELTERLRREGADAGATRTDAAQPDVTASRENMREAANALAEAATRESRTPRTGQPNAQQNAQQSAQQNEQSAQQSAQRSSPPGQRTSAGQRGQDSSSVRSGDRTSGDSARPDSSRASGAGRDSSARNASGARDSAAGAAERALEAMARGVAPRTPPQAAGGARGETTPRDGQQQGQQAGRGTEGGGAERQGAAPQQGEASSGGERAGGGQQSPQAAQAAGEAADRMQRAADQLAEARDAQVDAWKQELGAQLDRAINETAQLARQQQQLEQQMQQGNTEGMQGAQGAVQQGVQQAAAQLEQASRGSALVSRRSQQAMAEAQRRVQQATESVGESGQAGGGERAQSAMRDASQALSEALSSLVRDRERVNASGSASGFGDMLEQMKQLAQQQASLNGQMSSMTMMQGGAQGEAAQQQARALARQQREVARGLQDVADADPTGRTEALAREAAQVAQQLDRGIDPQVAARQQELYRRLLDAGRLLEQDERDDEGPREARAGAGVGSGAPGGAARGAEAQRFRAPTWSDLRGLSAEERRLVLEYFRRLNGSPP